MREALLVHKLWKGFLKRKMKREMERAAEVEDAYQRIKAATVSESLRVGADRCAGNSA